MKEKDKETVEETPTITLDVNAGSEYDKLPEETPAQTERKPSAEEFTSGNP